MINQMFRQKGTPGHFHLALIRFLKNVGAQKLSANWLTLQIYCVVHNYAKLLNYANILRARKVGDNTKCKMHSFTTP